MSEQVRVKMCSLCLVDRPDLRWADAGRGGCGGSWFLDSWERREATGTGSKRKPQG